MNCTLCKRQDVSSVSLYSGGDITHIPEEQLIEVVDSILDEISRDDTRFQISCETDLYQFEGHGSIRNWEESHTIFPKVTIYDLDIIPGNDDFEISCDEIERCKKEIASYMIDQMINID